MALSWFTPTTLSEAFENSAWGFTFYLHRTWGGEGAARGKCLGSSQPLLNMHLALFMQQTPPFPSIWASLQKALIPLHIFPPNLHSSFSLGRLSFLVLVIIPCPSQLQPVLLSLCVSDKQPPSKSPQPWKYFKYWNKGKPLCQSTRQLKNTTTVLCK